MKVFLTGATGAVGPATVRGLLERGHEVRAVARSDEKAATLRALGAEPVAVDLFDPDGVEARRRGLGRDPPSRHQRAAREPHEPQVGVGDAQRAAHRPRPSTSSTPRSPPACRRS